MGEKVTDIGGTDIGETDIGEADSGGDDIKRLASYPFAVPRVFFELQALVERKDEKLLW